jgi:hypothetical protein
MLAFLVIAFAPLHYKTVFKLKVDDLGSRDRKLPQNQVNRKQMAFQTGNGKTLPVATCQAAAISELNNAVH